MTCKMIQIVYYFAQNVLFCTIVLTFWYFPLFVLRELCTLSIIDL